jgi:hypothetical protein
MTFAPPDPLTLDIMARVKMGDPTRPCTHGGYAYVRDGWFQRLVCTRCHKDCTEESRYWID